MKLRSCPLGALFDPALRFHLYDLDFCRTAHTKGLSVGTWPLAVTHQSGGAFGGPEWERMNALDIGNGETDRGSGARTESEEVGDAEDSAAGPGSVDDAVVVDVEGVRRVGPIVDSNVSSIQERA